MKKSNEMLVVTLAELLSVKEIKSEVIIQALELIGKGFGFDYGLVYEINQSNSYDLKEKWNIGGKKPREEFSLDTLTPKYKAALAEKALFFIEKNNEPNEMESEISKFFDIESGVVIAISDKDLHINGIIALAAPAEKNPAVPDERKKEMTTLLAMLARYISSRIDEHKIGYARSALESILDNTGIDIYVNDFLTHEILYVNKSMAAPYGGKENFMGGQECWKVLYEGQTGPCEFCPQKKLIDEEGKPTKIYSWDYERALDGSWFRVFSAAFRWVDGRLAHVVSSADITDNKKNEALIRYMANFDSLTNLPNRRKLLEDFNVRIDQAKEDEKAYVVFFDIDGFKDINDTFGHDAGDEFLVQLGMFFSEIPELKDCIYRNGGDEFIAIIGGEDASEEKVRSLIDVLHQRFQKCWSLAKGDAFCNISAGVSCFPENGTAAEQLLQEADQAMYKAKKSGGGTLYFCHEISQ